MTAPLAIALLALVASVQTHSQTQPQPPALTPAQTLEAHQHRERGQHLLDQGDLTAALPEFERAVALDPRDARSHDAIGIILGETGKLEEAIAAFQRAIAIDARVAAPHFHLGLAYDRAGRVPEAIGEYQRALQLEPELIEARYGLSIACAELGDLDGAIGLLRQVIAARSQLADAHYNLGLHLWERFKATVGPKQSKDLDDAVAALTQAVRLDPNEPRAQSALGQLLVDKRDLVPAIEHLRRAETLAPDNPEHAYNLGLALRLNGDVDAAAREFRTALRLNPAHALARRSLGLILRQQDDLVGAATELRQSVSQLPDDALGHHLLGTVLLKQGDVPAAIAQLQEAVRLDPQLAEAHVNLAQSLARAGRRDEALQEQTAIQHLNERNANIGRVLILLETANTHLTKGDPSAALTDLREATTLTPDFAEAHYQLALALLASGAHAVASGGDASAPGGDSAGQPNSRRSGAVAEAESELRRAIALDGTHARAFAALGRLLARRGDRVGALDMLRRATQVAPGLVEAQRDLARVAVDAKDWATAILAYTAVLVWDPVGGPARGETQRALSAAVEAQARTRGATR